MKANDLVKDALMELGVSAAEQPVTADEFRTAVRYANAMFASKTFLKLGYTPVKNASDDVTIPDYAEEWAVKALAIRLAPQFPPTESFGMIVAAEKEAYHALLQNHQKIRPSRYPNTLPVGAGNECYSGIRFYPGECRKDEDNGE